MIVQIKWIHIDSIDSVVCCRNCKCLLWAQWKIRRHLDGAVGRKQITLISTINIQFHTDTALIASCRLNGVCLHRSSVQWMEIRNVALRLGDAPTAFARFQFEQIKQIDFHWCFIRLLVSLFLSSTPTRLFSICAVCCRCLLVFLGFASHHRTIVMNSALIIYIND